MKKKSIRKYAFDTFNITRSGSHNDQIMMMKTLIDFITSLLGYVLGSQVTV